MLCFALNAKKAKKEEIVNSSFACTKLFKTSIAAS